MTTYEAAPNTDGQILIPVRKKPPVDHAVDHKSRSSGTAKQRRPLASDISAPRFETPARPQSSPIHGPTSRPDIRTPARFHPQQNLISNNNSSARFKIREAASGNWCSANPRPLHVQAPAHLTSNERTSVNSAGPQAGIQTLPPIPKGKDENVLDLTVSSEREGTYEGEDADNAETSMEHRKGSQACDFRSSSFPTVSYMNASKHPVITAPLQGSLLNTRVKVDDVERVNKFDFFKNPEAADILKFRAGRKLPPLPIRGAAHDQNNSHITPSIQWLTLPPFAPRATASPALSTLEHAAVTTLASFNHGLDSNISSPIPYWTSSSSLNLSAPADESPGSPTRKRRSSLISNPISAPTKLLKFKSPVSPTITGLEPATKRIRIDSLLNPISSPSFPSSPHPTLASVSAPLIPEPQATGPIRAQTPINCMSSSVSDSEHDTLMSPTPSETYPSPPASPTRSLVPSSLPSQSVRLVPRPLIPRSHVPNSTLNAQSQLLFFNNQIYSPLPLPSQTSPRSSSAPPRSSSSTPSLKTKSLPRKHFAYRAWKLRHSRTILTSLTPSNAPQYLVVIRNDDRTTQSSPSSSSDGNKGRWWGIINGKEDMEEIRNIFK